MVTFLRRSDGEILTAEQLNTYLQSIEDNAAAVSALQDDIAIVHVGTEQPANPDAGTLWFDTDEPSVEFDSPTIHSDTVAPTSPDVGDFWYDPTGADEPVLTETAGNLLYADRTNTEAAILRTDPGDNPADTLIIRDASGNPVSVAAPHVYAEARGVVPNSIASAANNSVIIQGILDENKIAIIPSSTHYDTTLSLRSSSGIICNNPRLGRLFYTGATGHGIVADTNDTARVEGAILANFRLTASGGTDGSAFWADCWRLGYMENVWFERFGGSGLHLGNDSEGGNGTWTNRYVNCFFRYNGRHGIESTGYAHNAEWFYGCQASINALDGVYAEKPQGWKFGIQSEGNGRHAFHILGGFPVDLSGCYVEHGDPGTFADPPPGYTTQSPRYVIKLEAAPDGTRLQAFTCNGALLSSKNNGTTTITNKIIHAEDTNYIEMLANYVGPVEDVEEPFHIGESCSDALIRGNQPLYYDPNTTEFLLASSKYQHGIAPSSVTSRGLLSQFEGIENLLENGGFDHYVLSTGAPPGWTLSGASAARQTVAGGYRVALTNLEGGSQHGHIRQLVAGEKAQKMTRAGIATLVFDAIIPESNLTSTAGIRIRCQDGSANDLDGSIEVAANLSRNDDLKTYTLRFAVHPNTEQVYVYLYSSVTGSENVNEAIYDNVALYAGETPKAYQPQWLKKPVEPDAYTVTNGTTSRSFDADTVTTAELADVVASIIADLQNGEIVG